MDQITLSQSKKYTDQVAMGITNVYANEEDTSINFTVKETGEQAKLVFPKPKDGTDALHYGSDAPTDERIKVWVDPTGESDFAVTKDDVIGICAEYFDEHKGELAEDLDQKVAALEQEAAITNHNVEKNKKSIDILYKLAQGIVYDFEKIEGEGTIEPIAGAQYGSVLELDGKSAQENLYGYNLVSLTEINKHWLASGSCEKANMNGRIALTLAPNVKSNENLTISVKRLTTKSISVGIRFLKNGQYVSTLTRGFGAITAPTTSFMTIDSCESYNADSVKIFLFNGDNNIVESDVADIQVEYGSVAHDYEPYCGGVAIPNASSPKAITGTTEIHIKASADGTTEEYTMIPPKPLYNAGDHADKLDFERGCWSYVIKDISIPDYSHSVVREPEYFITDETTLPASEQVLDLINKMSGYDGDITIKVTDQNGNDLPYVAEFIIHLASALEV